LNTKNIPMSRRDAKIATLFESGLTCSKIDQMMSLVEGTARAVIVKLWALDKEMAVRAKRAKAESEIARSGDES